jgi:hypothetical protein
MPATTIQRLDSLAVEITDAAQSHAAPSADTDGLSLAGWKNGGFSPDSCIAWIGTASDTVAISAGAYWAGYDANLDEWFRIADVNEGAAVALSSTGPLGWAQRLVDVGVFDRLILVDTGDANTHKYGFKPIESLE